MPLLRSDLSRSGTSDGLVPADGHTWLLRLYWGLGRAATRKNPGALASSFSLVINQDIKVCLWIGWGRGSSQHRCTRACTCGVCSASGKHWTHGKRVAKLVWRVKGAGTHKPAWRYIRDEANRLNEGPVRIPASTSYQRWF